MPAVAVPLRSTLLAWLKVPLVREAPPLLTASRVGALGVVVLTVRPKASESRLSLPALSLAITVKLCAPSASTPVWNTQAPVVSSASTTPISVGEPLS